MANSYICTLLNDGKISSIYIWLINLMNHCKVFTYVYSYNSEVTIAIE